MAPWTDDQIRLARGVPLLKLMKHICDLVNEDRNYKPRDPSRTSRRFQVNCQKRDFRVIVTGEKWIDELVERDLAGRGGGGGIDLVMHLTGVNFVQAVKLCLESLESKPS